MMMIVDMDGDEDPSSWSSHRSSPSRKRGRSAEGKQCAKTAELSLQSTSIPVSQWYGDTILKMRIIMLVIDRDDHGNDDIGVDSSVAVVRRHNPDSGMIMVVIAMGT